jgi:hypothetical protein
MSIVVRCVVVGLAVLLSACGGSVAAPAPTSGASTAPPVVEVEVDTPDPAPTSAAEPSPEAPVSVSPPIALGEDAVLVIYERSGGIAGVQEKLTIYANGRLEFNKKGSVSTRTISSSDLTNLWQLLASDEFAKLNSRYQVAGADFFRYQVTLMRQDGRPQVVSTMDTAEHPATLDLVLAELMRLQSLVANAS